MKKASKRLSALRSDIPVELCAFTPSVLKVSNLIQNKRIVIELILIDLRRNHQSNVLSLIGKVHAPSLVTCAIEHVLRVGPNFTRCKHSDIHVVRITV